jgi:hypothetical protein
MTKRILTMRNMITGGVVIITSALGTAGVASAASTHTASTTHLTIKSVTSSRDLPGDPSTMPLGPSETVLSGTALSSAVAAADTAVPNATVLRAESGSSGIYEVHMKKADGTHVTVVEDSSFTVTSVDEGFGSGNPGFPGDPAKLTHGPRETLLTGSSLTSAVASANAAVPNATVVRAETDAQGGTYEVHLKKADGTYVSVKENASFVVTSTESGFGTPPVGAPGTPDAMHERAGVSVIA